jgi:hypothetical protein
MQEGALSFEHVRHERAQGLGANEDQPQKDRDLQNANASHNFLLELLRTEQRVDQVDKQPQRRDSGNDVIHVVVLYSLSQALVKIQHSSKNAHPIAT